MMCLAHRGVTADAGEDARASRFGMPDTLEEEHAATITHGKAIALHVERPRRTVRIPRLRERARALETRIYDRSEQRLHTSGERALDLAALDPLCGKPDRIERGSTRCAHCELPPAQTPRDTDARGGHVRNDEGHELRRDSTGLLDELHLCLGEQRQTAHRVADDHCRLARGLRQAAH